MWRNCWGLLSNKVMTNLPATIWLLLCNCLQEFSFLAIHCRICACSGCVCMAVDQYLCCAGASGDAGCAVSITPLWSVHQHQWDVVTSNAVLSHCSNICCCCFHQSQRELFHWFQDQTEKGKERKKKEREREGAREWECLWGIFHLTDVWHFHLQFWLNFP